MKAMYEEINDNLEMYWGVRSEKTRAWLLRLITALIGSGFTFLWWLTLKLGWIPVKGGGGRIHNGEFGYSFTIFFFAIVLLMLAHVLWLSFFGDKHFKLYALVASAISLCALLYHNF